MCGFAGFVNLSGLPGVPEERNSVLESMLSRIAHRGPDDEVLHDDGMLALGFRRLSIVDVEGGRQPFRSENGNLLAVVNGEIYNHQDLRFQLENSYRFDSHSDSEVVLPLYRDRGINMFDNVNGIYAVAIWDAPNRRLVLARDRLGVKPLYYAIVQDTLLFGSELKALLAHPACPRELNWQQVGIGNAVHQPEVPSYVMGVHHLPAGHILVFEPGKPVRPFPYWSLNQYFAGDAEEPEHSIEYFVERYGELLDDSVNKQLMSDVPLGIFLSGGIDSSLVAAIASSHVEQVHCFTIAEKTTAMTGDFPQAQKVASDLSFPLHSVAFNGPAMLDELQFDLGYLEFMIWCADSPRFNIEWFFKHELYRYAKTRLPELKVILTGAGADEFAGGYSQSYAVPERTWQEYLVGHVQPKWDSFRRLEDKQPKTRSAASSFERYRSSRSTYQQMMYMNLSSLQVYNLWYEDRMSAAYGIEARVPFLDHRLVEFLASVPPSYHETLFRNKQIVRKQLGKFIPEYPVEFPKVPFVFVPGNDSIRALRSAILKRTFHDFTDKYVKPGDPFLPRKRLERLYQRATRGSRNSGQAEQQLMWLMQTAIFRDCCLNGWQKPPSIASASPLKAHPIS